MQLHLEELEDRSRRNNLRLRSIPETIGPEGLEATVIALFHKVLKTPPLSLELDRVHRIPGPRSSDLDRPRDVLCRLYSYQQKEIILRKAWEHGDAEIEGRSVKILPDISRATLQRRAILRPILDLAKRHDCTYRWGYPLTFTFRKAQASLFYVPPWTLQPSTLFCDQNQYKCAIEP